MLWRLPAIGRATKVSQRASNAAGAPVLSQPMDELTRAAEMIDSALEAIEKAVNSNPDLRDAFARRRAHLRELRAEIERRTSPDTAKAQPSS
jgi:hypothetical protein